MFLFILILVSIIYFCIEFYPNKIHEYFIRFRALTSIPGHQIENSKASARETKRMTSEPYTVQTT